LWLGGTLGSGKQYFPWISVTDQVAAVMHLLNHPVSGPVNVTAPYPVTNKQFTKELGRALHRPTPWIIPGFALHIVLGEFGGEIMTGQRALPIVLHESGFEFTHRTLTEALAAELP
jgi:NAD dependent epimerase/dehydratase family enzyme